GRWHRRPLGSACASPGAVFCSSEGPCSRASAHHSHLRSKGETLAPAARWPSDPTLPVGRATNGYSFFMARVVAVGWATRITVTNPRTGSRRALGSLLPPRYSAPPGGAFSFLPAASSLQTRSWRPRVLRWSRE